MKTIILIPYRDREEHLKYFLENTAPLLNEKIENLEILIIEQSEDGKRFNRGKILNVGFDYYNEDEYYYITQDVDTNPIENTFDYYKMKINNDSVLSITSPHKICLGGIIKMNGKTFRRINGFRNDIWGWGLEDRDFYYRCINKKIGIKRINKKKVRFNFLQHDRPITIHSKLNKNIRKRTKLIFKSRNIELKENYIMESGLNNLKYDILEEIVLNSYIKKIIVEI